MKLANILALNGNRTEGENVTDKPLPFHEARQLFKELVAAGIAPRGLMLPVLVLACVSEGVQLVHKFKAAKAARAADPAGDVPGPEADCDCADCPDCQEKTSLNAAAAGGTIEAAPIPAAVKLPKPAKAGRTRNPGDGQK